jgi:hypothetical protein
MITYFLSASPSKDSEELYAARDPQFGLQCRGFAIVKYATIVLSAFQ